jgi:hypothetical protein
MAHTPGPWYAEGSDIGSAENVTVGVAIAGRTDDAYISHAEVQANAHLMAAAPDLLAALLSFIALHEDGSLHIDGSPAIEDPAITAARAAIAKAEGKELPCPPTDE